MKGPKYRWPHVHAWFEEKIQSWSEAMLAQEIIRLAAVFDADTLQDLYQSDMSADGYFEAEE